MTALVLYLSTALVFLSLDAVMLKNVLRPIFETHLGDQLAEDFRLGPAAVFYLFYVGGLVALISLPVLRGDGTSEALWKGALVGAMAYGTYEFTSYAVMARWSVQMVMIDVAWGTVLTGVSAAAGVWITRAVLG
ncbi:DUF2177 family protein [Aliiroseovarius sp. PTFE2010]|uniref:DUF2177 family protein n=1 Tax=Aliiroseovarius sp. PTFE2010 TaxID=3417190 RepID=UPI003CEBC4AD